MKVTESKENLISNSYDEEISTEAILKAPIERPLSQIEKTFLLHAERGDCATVRQIIGQYRENPQEFDINCVDPLNRSALTAAIENENIELIKLLLTEGILVKDGLLHAIKEEYVEAVEVLLNWEEEHHKLGEPYSWEQIDKAGASFTTDITPLILAAHKNNYEIIKILLDRGATLPMPHDVRCGCDECVQSSKMDSLRHSQSRINAYRALSSPSLISLSSSDPLLTAFELSWDLRRLSRMETEFRAEYNDMRNQVQTFATSLLDHARTSYELEIMLNYDPDGETWVTGERQTLERLKLAIKYKQKQFIAHPNVQQLLASIWYEGLPGFRRKNMIGQGIQLGKIGAMFPIYCTLYMLAPTSPTGLFVKKPFVKFICHSSSYAFFLMLLGAASQRVEILVLEWFGPEWVQDIVREWKRKERGAFFGIAECGVIIYVISLIWGEMKSLWTDGILDYISDLWNIVDFITNVFYVLWMTLRLTSIYICWTPSILFQQIQKKLNMLDSVGRPGPGFPFIGKFGGFSNNMPLYNTWKTRDEREGKLTWYPREEWDSFEPILLSEGAFAAGMIFSFLKLVHIFSVNPHLGPLQISLGRMIIDIVKFFFIYTLVLFAFGCGLNQLLWYYAELEKNKCYHLPSGLPDFDNNDKACTIWRRYSNLFETSQSLFWASFGLVDLMCFELTGIKGFTRFWALLMFGSYSVINVIVLLNMLIAMMSNSYQIISERADTEWKFARSRLWISYFDDGETLPPPFNIIPKPKVLMKTAGCAKSTGNTASFKNKSREKAREKHEIIMRLLVRRYVTAEQRKRDDFGITEDDVMEIRQDISSLRYELIDILRNNGMKTPKINVEDTQISGKKGKVMERRLLKDFHIGIVEGIVNEIQENPMEPKNVFGQIAKVIGRRTTSKSSKKDWNALVRKNTVACNPIGSAQEAEESKKKRQSLRKHIITNVEHPVKIEDEKLLEYNPKLSEVPRTARLAYAKFMSKKIEEDYNTEGAKNQISTQSSVTSNKNREKEKMRKTSVTFQNGDATQETAASTNVSPLQRTGTKDSTASCDSLNNKPMRKKQSIDKIITSTGTLPPLTESATPDNSRSSTPCPPSTDTPPHAVKTSSSSHKTGTPVSPASQTSVEASAATLPKSTSGSQKSRHSVKLPAPAVPKTTSDGHKSTQSPKKENQQLTKKTEKSTSDSQKSTTPKKENQQSTTKEDEAAPPSMRSKLTGQKRTGWI